MTKPWLQNSVIRAVSAAMPCGIHVTRLITEIYGDRPPLNPERVLQRAVSRVNAKRRVQIYAIPRAGRNSRRFIKSLESS